MNDYELVTFLDSLHHIAGYERLDQITISSRDLGGDTPLHIAIYQGNMKAAQMLISAGADVNAVGEDGFTPLHCAIVSRYTELVDEIIRMGGDLKRADIYGTTAQEMLAENLVSENKADDGTGADGGNSH